MLLLGEWLAHLVQRVCLVSYEQLGSLTAASFVHCFSPLKLLLETVLVESLQLLYSLAYAVAIVVLWLSLRKSWRGRLIFLCRSPGIGEVVESFWFVVVAVQL